MPTYEYRCTHCGNRVEVFQRIGEDPLTVCEVCGGMLRKIFHPAGIVFKGSGFYATDSRKARTGSGDGKGSSGGEQKGGGEKAPSESAGSEAKSSEKGPEKGPTKTSSSDAGSKGKSS